MIPLTRSASSASMTSVSAPMTSAAQSIDLHCHFLRFGNGRDAQEGFLHPSFQNSIKVRTYLRNVGINTFSQWLGVQTPLSDASLNVLYALRLREHIEQSCLDHVVVLALDGRYDVQGNLDRDKTAWYVSNDTVMNLAGHSPKILAGASINPTRKDWEDELEKCIENNVALIKWLPNVMGFDPANPKFLAFYERLADENIPILSHVGFEYAVDVVNDSYAELERLTLPLEIGVKVIAAHCCGGRPFIDSGRMFQSVVDFAEKHKNFYMDISAMASVHRRSRLANSLRNDITRERLVYGTDYPIPVHRWAFGDKMGVKESVRPEYNPLNSDLQVKGAMGVDEKIMARGYGVINPRCMIANSQH